MNEVHIDPENFDQVSVLMGHFSRQDGRIFGIAGVKHMQAALRQMPTRAESAER